MCCSKIICGGCVYANEIREDDASMVRSCPFCREAVCNTKEVSRTKCRITQGHGIGSLPSVSTLAWMQPSHPGLLQHDCNVNLIVSCDVNSGIGSRQIGQSPRWLLSGCLNNNSSRNSAAHFLHASSCSDLWSIWQSSLQYFTRSQSSHFLNLISSISAMPQEAQHVSASFSSPSLIFV